MHTCLHKQAMVRLYAMNRMHAGAQPAKCLTHNDHAMAKVARCTDSFNVLHNTKPHSRVVGWWNENKSVRVDRSSSGYKV
jgi:hypothetical protein